MAYHADYWVLVGTAAPVITLAAIATLGPAALGLSAQQQAGTYAGRLRPNPKHLLGWYGAAYLTAIVNIVIQINVMSEALTSLALGRDFQRAGDASDMVITGFWLLVAGVAFRAAAQEAEHKKRETSHRSSSALRASPDPPPSVSKATAARATRPPASGTSNETRPG
jgi:hypothetical protein